MPFAKEFVELPFGMLAYVSAGKMGDPLVLLHGIPTSSFLWRGVIPGVEDAFSVYALDMLGYGDSDKPPEADISVGAQAGYLKEWADAVGLDSFHVAGHDIGGGVAQIFAVRYPQRVKRLVLIDTVCYDSWPVADIARLKDPSWDRILHARDLRPGFRRALEGGMVHRERVNDEMLEGYVGPFLARAGRQAYLRCARALDNKDTQEIAHHIEALPHPTLILWGEQDPFQSVDYGQRLAAAMPNARLETCPDGGHFLPEDRPDWVAEQIREFIQTS